MDTPKKIKVIEIALLFLITAVAFSIFIIITS